MNLGFHYHTPAYVGANGKIFTAGYLGVFLDSLAIEFDTLTCFLHDPLTSEMNKMDYEIKALNVKLVSIGPHYNLVKRLLVNPSKIKESRESFYSIDVMLLRVPTPFVHPIYKNTLKFEVPVVLLIVGDYIQSAKELKSGLVKKWLIQAFSYFNAKQQRKIARKALVFVNSRLLFEQYKMSAKKVIEVRTTTLSLIDFYDRLDTCNGNKIQLLYTGRIDLAKGLMEMLDALTILNEREPRYFLNIVGWEERADEPIKNEILEKARTVSQENHVIFHGKKTIGEELNKMYRMADIYLIASKGSEGFPRTIWEAMANGLPVIASRIGSIPYFLSDGKNALFIEPGNVMDIARNVKNLVHNENLRKKLIKNGFKLARANTLGVQARKMKVCIEKYHSNEI